MEKNKTIVLPKYLGCRPDDPDSRDKIYDEIAGKRPSAMPFFREGFSNQEKYGPLVKDDQYRAYSCVGEGSSNDTEMSYLITTGQKIHLSALDIYSQIHLQNGGASPRDAYKLLNKKGVCEVKYLPRPSNLSEAQARKRGIITDERLDNAKRYKIGKYYNIRKYDPEIIAQAIFENGGVGGGYKGSGAMGHFIFLEGYGFRDYLGQKLYAIKILDSYPPFAKWIVWHKGKTYLNRPSNYPIQLFSHWTFQPNEDWAKIEETNKPKEEIKHMSIKLERKKEKKPVLMIVNSKPYWFKEADDFENFAKEFPEVISWPQVDIVKEFTFPFQGKIIGSPEFKDVVKNYLNAGKK